jgi:hypothetical protein
MGLLYGRAGRLNTKNAGFRPGQFGVETHGALGDNANHPTEGWISDPTACKTKVYEGPLGVVTWNETLVLLGLYTSYGPGPPERLSALSISLCKSVLYGDFVWARRALNSQKRRFPARTVVLCAMFGKLMDMCCPGMLTQGVPGVPQDPLAPP